MRKATPAASSVHKMMRMPSGDTGDCHGRDERASLVPSSLAVAPRPHAFASSGQRVSSLGISAHHLCSSGVSADVAFLQNGNGCSNTCLTSGGTSLGGGGSPGGPAAAPASAAAVVAVVAAPPSAEAVVAEAAVAVPASAAAP